MLIREFLSDEGGATAIEYGLLAAILSLAMVFGATLTGDETRDMFIFVGNTIRDALA